MVQLYWLGIHAGIFLRHAITIISLKTKIFIFIDAVIAGGGGVVSLISPKYVLLLTAGCSYQPLLTPLLAACTEFTISDSDKTKTDQRTLFFPYKKPLMLIHISWPQYIISI